MTWFYLSFADEQKFLGGCFVRVDRDGEFQWVAEEFIRERRKGGEPDQKATDLALAVFRSHRLGINPGGSVAAVGPIPEEQMETMVPPEDRERLLSEEEVRRGNDH